MTDDQIEYMAQRFLGWRIPEPFRPDAGISFDPVFNKGTRYEGKHQPLGTNLWGYTEAVEMVRHMVEGLPATERTRPPIGTDEVVERVKLEFFRDYPLSVGYGLSENGRDYAVRDEHFRAAADEFADRLIAAMPTIDRGEA